MQLAAAGESFDGQQVLFVRVADGRDAGRDAFAVQQDGAGATLAFAAAVLGAGQFQLFAQDLQQRPLRIRGDGSGLAVDRESDG